ncbi:MAG: hypothetical protein KAJ07_11630 [Planctomycetes bacterium]|nr:hypothetical protein [Planctomycetota bacterium]
MNDYNLAKGVWNGYGDAADDRQNNGIAKRRLCDYNYMLVTNVPCGLYDFDIARTKWRTK